MKFNTVFLLEDDQDIGEVVQCALDINSFRCRVFTEIKQLYMALKETVPEVCLLDIMLPDGSGLDALQYIKRNYSSVKCIMLTALGQEVDKVKGLNLGADDYIVKPFGVLELVARVNVQLRSKQSTGNILTVGSLVIDKDTMAVQLNGNVLDLNKKEYQLLCYCVENIGKVLSREQMLEAVWGYDVGETRTVDNHIARLRKLGFRFETVFGVGYKFVV